ncbi:MAG: multiubiquitin domain-containing protein [bacterium]
MEDKEIKQAGTNLKATESAEHKIEESLQEINDAEHHHEIQFEIQIDRESYKVDLKQMTGLQLRALPSAPIGPDRDLFEIVPGGTDQKISNEEIVEIRNGLRFFSAPAQINPGILKSIWRLYNLVALQ